MDWHSMYTAVSDTLSTGSAALTSTGFFDEHLSRSSAGRLHGAVISGSRAMVYAADDIMVSIIDGGHSSIAVDGET